jgi:DHA1 family bicyclomycin/chloramphenicol resistance-like MFS transporter
MTPRPAVLIAIVSVLVLIAPFSNDIFLPSMPSMARDLATDYGSVQLALSSFMLGIGISQLIIGPLSDAYGRRPVLKWALILYVGASVVCVFAPNIETLLGARFVQSVGGCAGLAVGRAVIRDRFEGAEAAQAYAYIATALAAGPMLGPIIGGQIEVWFNWRGSFVFLTVLGLVALVAVIGALGETNSAPNKEAMRPSRLVRGYAAMFRDRRYLGYAVTITATYGGVFAFISGSAFVFIELMGVAPDVYGLGFAIAIGGYGAGTFTASQISARIGIDGMILIGGLIACAATLCLVGFAWAGALSMWAIVVPVTVFTYGTGFVFPNCQAGAIMPYPHMAGAAAALLGSIQMAAAALIGALVGQLHDGTAWPMVIIMACCGAGIPAAHILLVGRRGNPGSVR